MVASGPATIRELRTSTPPCAGRDETDYGDKAEDVQRGVHRLILPVAADCRHKVAADGRWR